MTTHDRVVGIARAGQGGEHDEGAQQDGGQKGAEQSGGHGKMVNKVEGTRQGREWHVMAGQGRAGQGRAGQGRAAYGRAIHGKARQEQGQEPFSEGQGRVVAGAGA